MIVQVSTIIEAPLDKVWPWLDDFTTWHRWIPSITATEMRDGLDQGPVGSIRDLELAVGGTAAEQLLSKDAVNHTFSYTFYGPTRFPVRKYVGSVWVAPVTTDGTTFIQWTGTFEADAADEPAVKEIFEGIYASFFEALKKSTAS
jgi:hypothetical protein